MKSIGCALIKIYYIRKKFYTGSISLNQSIKVYSSFLYLNQFIFSIMD